MNEILEPKIINELCQYSFYIPAYQRGYRWTEQEAFDLLNDINDFKPRQIRNSEEKTWYCLQPIVVKNKIENEFEVIDGQQRLTTIYLVLHYLNQDFIESRRDKLFNINYQTRTDTAIFLQNLGSNDEANAKSNIDFYYIRQVYSAIEKWFSERGNNFDINDFRSKFKFNTKIIWYENSEEDSISVFTRLNIGKIRLSNAELIKALYLNSSNFGINATEKDKSKLKQKQLEISTEWDNIENTLHDNKFWYFLINTEKAREKASNRIELIFDIMSKKPSTNDPFDVFYTFRYFNDKFTNRTTKIIDDNWKDVKTYFQRFHEWYSERNLYHIIGYLICVNEVTIHALHDDSSEMTKSEFERDLQERIKNSLSGIKLSELRYGDKNVKSVLLLYNILTMLQNGNENSKFPFDIFKNEGWDIEHITAIKEDMPKDSQRWLEDVLSYMDINKNGAKELIDSIKSFDKDAMSFETLFISIINHFDENIDDDEQLHHISNLALLDSVTNRGYKNAVFPVKRKTIIDRDKSGIFIPICTKNVFLKYFTDYPPKISFWTNEDREKYEQDLYMILKDYLEE